MKKILILTLVLLIVGETQVHAYTDPGSGALLWQILVASLVGVMFYLRRIIAWVRGLKSRRGLASGVGSHPGDTNEETGHAEG